MPAGPVGHLDARRPVRAAVTPRRACLGTPGARTVARRGGRGRTRLERLLAGAAVTLCSATVVVLLGLVADLSAGGHATPSPVTPSGASPVSSPLSSPLSSPVSP